jgi:hypothetical protein
MRHLVLAVAALALAAPAPARADLSLGLVAFDGAPAPRAHLEVGALALDGAPLLPSPLAALDEGGGAGARGHRVEPVLALVLGIIPGFGIGHLIANAPSWVIWLVVDVVLAVVFWGPFIYWNGRPGYFPVFNLLILVERIIEGIDAFRWAEGGRGLFHDLRGFSRASPAELALPEGRALAAGRPGW